MYGVTEEITDSAGGTLVRWFCCAQIRQDKFSKRSPFWTNDLHLEDTVKRKDIRSQRLPFLISNSCPKAGSSLVRTMKNVCHFQGILRSDLFKPVRWKGQHAWIEFLYHLWFQCVGQCQAMSIQEIVCTSWWDGAVGSLIDSGKKKCMRAGTVTRHLAR
mgnify:FL=1